MVHIVDIEVFYSAHCAKIKEGGNELRDHVIVTINGTEYLADPGQNLLDLINTTSEFVPQICYNE